MPGPYYKNWIPMARRVDFKILVLTHKVMHDEAPVYLCELVRPCQPARAQQVKRTRIKAGDGSFAVAAASLWKTLYNLLKSVTLSPSSNFYNHTTMTTIPSSQNPNTAVRQNILQLQQFLQHHHHHHAVSRYATKTAFIS